MKYIKELIINKDQIEIIINQKIEIKNLEIKNLSRNEEINFLIKNKNIIIKNKIENLSSVLLLNKEKLSDNDISELEDIIKNNSKYSFKYAEKYLARFKKGEKVISNDPEFVSNYAILLNKRWTDFENIDPEISNEIESLVLNNSKKMIDYIKKFLKGERQTKTEELLLSSNDSQTIHKYAKEIIQDRWIDGEKRLLELKNDVSIYYYAKDVMKDRWTDGEKILLENANDSMFSFTNIIYDYANNVIKGPWPEAEKFIFQDIDLSVNYAVYLTKKRLPIQVENRIANDRNTDYGMLYVQNILKKRWPEFEKNLLKIKKELDDILKTGVNEEDIEDIVFVNIESNLENYVKEIVKGKALGTEIK